MREQLVRAAIQKRIAVMERGRGFTWEDWQVFLTQVRPYAPTAKEDAELSLVRDIANIAAHYSSINWGGIYTPVQKFLQEAITRANNLNISAGPPILLAEGDEILKRLVRLLRTNNFSVKEAQILRNEGLLMRSLFTLLEEVRIEDKVTYDDAEITKYGVGDIIEGGNGEFHLNATITFTLFDAPFGTVVQNVSISNPIFSARMRRP